MNKELLHQALDRLEDTTRLLGITQAKKGYGVYTERDSQFEFDTRAVMAKHRRDIEAIAQPVQMATPTAVDLQRKIQQAIDALSMASFSHPGDADNVGNSCQAALETLEGLLATPEAQPDSKDFPFYELKFILRVLGHKGQAPREDWETAYGMAKEVFPRLHGDRVQPPKETP